MRRSTIVTFKIDVCLLEALDRYCKIVKTSRSETIREAIREYLEKRGVRIVCMNNGFEIEVED